ncbi:MAG: hypothetical protein M3Y73_08085 [Actinomycetota bacterium]|nr:hypothetical protein [Actinomycetota bacterium]
MFGADAHLTTTDLPIDPSFDADPIAPHSAQFPLGRVSTELRGGRWAGSLRTPT